MSTESEKVSEQKSCQRKLTVEEILSTITWFYQEATRRYLADKDSHTKDKKEQT